MINYDYTHINIRVDDMIAKIVDYNKKLDPIFVHDQVYKAYIYARDAHEGCMRLS